MIKMIRKITLLVLLLNIDMAIATYQPLQQIADGLYVSSKEVDGKTLYFALQNRPESIVSFRNYAINVGGRKQSTLRNAIYHIGTICANQTVDMCLENNDQLNFFNNNGLNTEEKKRAFVEYVLNSSLKGDRFTSIFDIRGMPSGASHTDRAGQNMFAWISTEPITQYRDFGYLGAADYTGGNLDIDQAYKTNQDLVILVSASFDNVSESKKNQYINIAGIFKPPHEVLYGDHKNISLLFHGFIAYVANSLGKEVYYIRDPASSMAKALDDAFVEGKPYRGVNLNRKDLYADIDGDELASDDIKLHTGFGGMGSKAVYASTKALSRLYTDSN